MKSYENEYGGLIAQCDIDDYLVVLRDAGATNMFGASSYIEEEFDLKSQDAKDALISWMQSFSEGQ